MTKKAGTETTEMKGGKKYTLVECGGVYEMQHKDPYGQTIRGLITSSANEGKKGKIRITGLLQIMGFKPELVEEGGDRMNQFKLVGRVVPVKSPGRPPKEK